MVQQGETFLKPSGPAYNPGIMHLHLICTGADSEGNVLVVSVTTWRGIKGEDSACILDIDDPDAHPFIRHKSWAFYMCAGIMPESDIQNNLGKRIFIPKEALSAAVFKRVYDGFLNSKFAKPKLKRYLRANSRP